MESENASTIERLEMIPVDQLSSTLTVCVLTFSKLDRYLCKVAGVGKQTRARHTIEVGLRRIKWAAWKEEEINGFISELQRPKMSILFILNIIQK